jgi:hypothetical protein
MPERREPEASSDPKGVNPGYPAFQIAKALRTSEEHGDPATRARATEKAAKWEAVLTNILTGSLEYGSRTPLKGIPAWVTTEVLTGGFATGELLAGGALQEHETRRLSTLPRVFEGEERRALNLRCLTDEGMAELSGQLRSGCYDLAVPEEGAMLVVAWLAEHGHAEAARELIAELAPFFPILRFYPVPLQHARHFGSRVHLKSVAEVIRDVRAITPNKRVLAQKEALQIWTPLHDRIVSMFLETVVDGWPCRHYPPNWSARASSLLTEFDSQSSTRTGGGKHARRNSHQAQLRQLLRRCVNDPSALTGRDVGRIRLILNRYMQKRGAPDSPECEASRQRERQDVQGPLFHTIASVVIRRLERHPKDEGLDDIQDIEQDVSADEASASAVPVGTALPPSIRRKIERCLSETVSALVERDVITSGEVMARVLPQVTSGIRAAGLSDPTLRPLYAAMYRAFRRRRSLLLLNLEKQVSIEELPWVAAINRCRSESLSTKELSKQALEEVVALVVTSFPQAILPNKLLQELRALATGADLQIPLVDEVAADIFMGRFSGKFVDSAHRASEVLDRTLYTTYYGIDYSDVRRIRPVVETQKRTWFWQRAESTKDELAELCASRAGVSLGTWDPATNGMIIEQQQILTTQNLAALFLALGLVDRLRGQLPEMAKRCFVWICKRQQIKVRKGHARSIMVKNTAYAWRQMVFFLSLASEDERREFLVWAEDHLTKQSDQFQQRFLPAIIGLKLGLDGALIEAHAATGARRFLGWSKEPHWLLAGLAGE